MAEVLIRHVYSAFAAASVAIQQALSGAIVAITN